MRKVIKEVRHVAMGRMEFTSEVQRVVDVLQDKGFEVEIAYGGVFDSGPHKVFCAIITGYVYIDAYENHKSVRVDETK